jgi:hypothetical protein
MVRKRSQPDASGLDFDVYKVSGQNNDIYAVKVSKEGFKQSIGGYSDYVKILEKVISGPVPYVPPMDIVFSKRQKNGANKDFDKVIVVMPWMETISRFSLDESQKEELISLEVEFKQTLHKLNLCMKDMCQFGKLGGEYFVYDLSSIEKIS